MLAIREEHDVSQILAQLAYEEGADFSSGPASPADMDTASEETISDDPLVGDDDNIYMPIQALEDEPSPPPPHSLQRPRPRPRLKRTGSLSVAVRRIIGSDDEAYSGEESDDAGAKDGAGDAAVDWEDTGLSPDDLADRTAGGKGAIGWTYFVTSEPTGSEVDTMVIPTGKSFSSVYPRSRK